MSRSRDRNIYAFTCRCREQCKRSFEYENPNAVDETLERLGVDYVDLLYIHQPAGNWLAGWKPDFEKA